MSKNSSGPAISSSTFLRQTSSPDLNKIIDMQKVTAYVPKISAVEKYTASIGTDNSSVTLSYGQPANNLTYSVNTQIKYDKPAFKDDLDVSYSAKLNYKKY